MAINSSTKPTLTAKDIERFWRRVDIRGADECWLWTRGCFASGYGAFNANDRTMKAHRVALLIVTGDWPEVAMHKCDVKRCCNVLAHVVAATQIDNVHDRDMKGRTALGDRNGSRVRIERMPRGESHYRVQHPEAYPIGVEHPNARLTEDEVRSIRLARSRGITLVDLADRYEVCTTTIRNVDQWKTYRTVS